MLKKIGEFICILILVGISFLMERHGFGEQEQIFFYIYVGIKILYGITKLLVISTDQINGDEMAKELVNDLFCTGWEMVLALIMVKRWNVDFFIVFELMTGLDRFLIFLFLLLFLFL